MLAYARSFLPRHFVTLIVSPHRVLQMFKILPVIGFQLCFDDLLDVLLNLTGEED